MSYTTATARRISQADIERLPNYQKRNNNEYRSACPFCGTGTARFAFWPNEGNYYCWVCGVKGFVSDVSDLTEADRQKWQAQQAQRRKATEARTEAQRTELRAALPSRVDYYHSQVDEARDYWHSEGLNDQTIDRFKLGYAPNCPTFNRSASYAIPYFEDGRPVTIRHRLIGRDKDKYRPEFAGLGSHLFNVDALATGGPAAYLVEGEKKAMRLAQDGLGPVVAIAGANAWQPSWAAQFAHFDVVYIAFDPGAEIAAERPAADLVKVGCQVVVATLPAKPDDYLNAGHSLAEWLAIVQAGALAAPDQDPPRAAALKPFELTAEAKAIRDEIRAESEARKAAQADWLDSVTFAPYTGPVPELKKLPLWGNIQRSKHLECPHAKKHAVYSTEGSSTTPFYCNDPKTCELCRQRHIVKLRFWLAEIADRAYIDKNGNAAYALPILTPDGEFIADTPGPGFWYGKIINRSERRAFLARYKRATPGGFIRPEAYTIPEGLLILSLTPFEDLEPVNLTDELLLRVVIGGKGRSAFLFAPGRKTLALALPRFTFELPSFLAERGIVETVKAAHSVLFTGPVNEKDIYVDFDTRAETFDDIRYALEEIGLKSIDHDRLRGKGDHAPDFVIQYIDITPAAKQTYLNVWNAGREGNTILIDLHRRKLPKLPRLGECVDKGMSLNLYKNNIPLSTQNDPFSLEDWLEMPAEYRPQLPQPTAAEIVAATQRREFDRLGV